MSDDLSQSSTEIDSSVTMYEVLQLKNIDNNPKEEKDKTLLNNLLSKIDSYDKHLSNYIHILELNYILENIIYIFGRLFNSDIIIIFYISLFLYQSFMNKNYYYIIKPFIHLFIVFILTGVLKCSFKRPRPEINKSVKRVHNLRKKEKNFSMPSGDSMQAANFAVVGLFYFNISYFGFFVIPFVMFSRIFYFCHYFFDTLIGALIGGCVSFLLVFPLRYLKL